MHYTREAKVGIFVLAAIMLFIFVGIQLGAFRFNRHGYAPYMLYFKDISGLTKKAEVKIAGVKVGWVDDIALIEQEHMYARVDMLIDISYCLYQDAYGMVRQEGLLGPTYLEIIPGSPTAIKLESGAHLAHPHVEPTSIDELLRTFKGIAGDIQEITSSFKQALGGAHAAQEMQELVGNVKQIVHLLKDEVLPTFQESISKIADVCDRDFSQFAERVATTADKMQDASELLTEGFRTMNDIATDIHEGHGFVGQLLQDEHVYQDLKYTTGKIKQGFKQFSDLYFIYDGHVENMFERAEHTCFKDAKGIFNVWIFARSDYFYLVGVTTSQKGYITRRTTFRDFTDDCLNEICSDECDLPDWAKFQYIFNKNVQRIKRNAFKVDLQIGKFYKNVALRAGLIEGTGGVAVDLFIPYKDHYGIMSTFKIYDFHGQNRIDDERPHLKWINKLFLFNHVYVAIGFDDFVSRCNRSFFLGAGFRFGDEELKWFLPNYVGT